MHIHISGNPLNRRDDNETIYVTSNVIPPKHSLDIDFKIEKKDIKSFIENLYFITMEENGYCYFYPTPEESDNLCRFEWHYDFRGKLYFLRIGLFFRVNNSSLKDIYCSIEQHEKYKDYKKEIPKCEINSNELNEIKKFILDKVDKAKERILLDRDKVFNRIYYLETNRPIEHFTYLDNESILLFPTYSSEGKLITSVILEIKAFSFVESSNIGDEKINLYCAFFSLAVGFVKIISKDEFPLISDGLITNKELYDKKISSFYPNCQKELFGLKFLDETKFKLLNWLYESFDNIKEKNKRKVKNIIFAYYAGVEAKRFNKTLSLVSFVSCMNSISKIFEPEYLKDNGDRKTIVYYLSKNLEIYKVTNSYLDLDKWSKKIYNDHRSSYVHGSNHKFEEYSQNFDGNSFPGIPSAMPSHDRVVTKQYEYKNDFEIAEDVVKFMIIKCFQDLSGIEYPEISSFMDIDFSLKSNYEGYIGIPNNNWFRIN